MSDPYLARMAWSEAQIDAYAEAAERLCHCEGLCNCHWDDPDREDAAMSDPVAALIGEALEFTNDAVLIVKAIEGQGYAIVNEERLARAMHDSDGWPDLRPGHKGEPHLWADCNTEHRGRYVTLAERYLAALRERP